MRTSHIRISTKRRVGTMFGQQYLFYDLGECAIKSLKIPKGLSESVNQRTDNTMDKIKRTNNDLQKIHVKLKIE